MDDYDEIEIRCLLADGLHCRYKTALKKVYGLQWENTKCIHRKLLKILFDQDQAIKETIAYLQEFPN